MLSGNSWAADSSAKAMRQATTERWKRRAFVTLSTSFHGLEADVLERLGGATDLEVEAERFLEQRDGLVRMPEQEVDPAQVVHQATEIAAIGDLLVDRPRPLGVRTCEHPVALAVGDDRGLEVDVGGRV